jgi:hypothetical protein
MNTGKSPYCKASLSTVVIEAVEAHVAKGKSYHALTYACPHCHFVLSVALDPVALKSDTVSEIVGALQDS